MNEKNYNKNMKKIRWYAYINKERSEDKLENIFGKDAIFVLGDWSKKNSPIKYISTPNLHMKKLLSKRFKVYLIDKYCTSKLYHRNCSEGENMKVTKKIESKILSEKKVNYELHSVLTFKMSNNSECINRDNNATLNMYKIVKSLIEHKKRPEEYCRKIKILTNVDQVESSVKNTIYEKTNTNNKSKKKEKIIIVKPKKKAEIKRKNQKEIESLN
jgi:hypothetical protein